ncbi:MAG: peptidoglycan DD-metalloendopeptidase family protein [Bacteroidota bacterium]
MSMLLFVASHSSARSTVSGPEDSVANPIHIELTALKQKNLIQCMNKEQLSSVVDYLFEMDTIPLDLLNEIRLAVANLKNENKTIMQPVIASNVSFPAADLYTSWEINNLFPEKDMLKLKGDTSVTLVLQAEKHGTYVHPFKGPLTSGFGWRDSAQHNGIDIDLNRGDKVVAAFDGMVRIAKRNGGFGNVVIIRHYNGLETVYAHLSKIKVKPGQVITAGALVGLGGSTGHSTGTHLHFEVRFKGVPINPKYLISFKEQKLLCNELTIKKTKWGLAAYPPDLKCYTIEKGDTVFEIAKRFATTTASIKQMNGFPSGRVRLRVGQVINVSP